MRLATLVLSVCLTISGSLLPTTVVSAGTQIDETRQALLDGLFTKYPSEHIKKVIYDPDGSQFIGLEMEKIRVLLDTEDYWRNLYQKSTDPKGSFEDFWQNFRGDERFRESIKGPFRLSLRKQLQGIISNAGGATTSNEDCTVSESSNVYFFDKAFLPQEMGSASGTVTIPAETVAEEAYVHESFHAEHNANGIPLAGGSRLTLDVCKNTAEPVRLFLTELAAYDSTQKFFRDKGDARAELLALFGMRQYIDTVIPLLNQQIKQDFFSRKDGQLILEQHQLAKTLGAEWSGSYDRIMKQLGENRSSN